MKRILFLALCLLATPAAAITTLDSSKPAATDLASVLPTYIRETRAKVNEVVRELSASAMYPVITVTSATHTITSAYSGHFYNNTGASGTVTLTLPDASSGLLFGVVRTATRGLRIKPSGSDTISTGGAGKYLELTSNDSYVVLYCNSAGKWTVIHAGGSYAMET
jgi:hypothetical protein